MMLPINVSSKHFDTGCIQDGSIVYQESQAPPLRRKCTPKFFFGSFYRVSYETDAIFFRIDLSLLLFELWAFEVFDFIKGFGLRKIFTPSNLYKKIFLPHFMEFLMKRMPFFSELIYLFQFLSYGRLKFSILYRDLDLEKFCPLRICTPIFFGIIL